MPSNTYDITIIGSGPAGYTAAIYAARANLSTLVIQGYESGGQLMRTSEVENYPGFAEGVTGTELMQRMMQQAEHFGAELWQEDAISLNIQDSGFHIQTSTKILTTKQ